LKEAANLSGGKGGGEWLTLGPLEKLVLLPISCTVYAHSSFIYVLQWKSVVIT
jgi:hypothetical protein